MCPVGLRGWVRSVWYAMLVPVVTATVTACEEEAPTAPLTWGEEEAVEGIVAERQLPEGLHLSIVVPHSRLAWGDTFTITSTITNNGSRALRLYVRICGLDLITDLDLEEAWISCSEYAQEVMLRPGDKLIQTEGGYVRSFGGRYQIRIRHLIDPAFWSDVMVVVQDV